MRSGFLHLAHRAPCTSGPSPSLRQAVPVSLLQDMQSLRELRAETGDIVVRVDEGGTGFEAVAVALDALLPSLLRHRLRQPCPHPRNSRLVEHDFLQRARLDGGVLGEERLEFVRSQSPLVAIGYLPGPREVEAVAPVGERILGGEVA